jgi:hypothetical protein
LVRQEKIKGRKGRTKGNAPVVGGLMSPDPKNRGVKKTMQS